MARARKGQGNVRKKGNRFQAIVQIDGKRYWQNFDREADGWDWISTKRTDALRGILGIKVEEKPAVMLFVDVVRLYRLAKADWREGTCRFYDGHMKTSLLPRFKDRPISDITASEIQTYLNVRRTCVSAMTVKKLFQLLSQVFNYAVGMAWIPKSPMNGVVRPKPQTKEKRCLRIHELRAILANCPEKDRALITVLILTGLRKGELFRMSWDWVDFDNEMILVKVAKCGSSKIPMSAKVKAVLWSLGAGDSGLVFPGRYRDREGDARFDPRKQLSNKRAAISRALEAAGVDSTGVSMHTFRHSFVTALEEIPGVSYAVVRALARHGKSSVTDHYLHVETERLRWALDQLEERLFAPSNVIPLRMAAG